MRSDPRNQRDPGTRPSVEVAILVALVGLAGALRVISWNRTAALFNDGPLYLGISRLMGAGDWSGALAHDYHPLYPFLTLLANFAAGDWERAAVAVSILSGSASVVLLYALVRPYLGPRVAALAGLVLAMHPHAVDFSADVQSEGLYLALFLGALLAISRSLDPPRPALAAWGGVLCGLAYLTRPEGIGVLGVAGALGAWRVLRGRLPLGRAVVWGAAVLAGVLLFVTPYMTAMRVETGSWVLSQKKSAVGIATMGRIEGRIRAGDESWGAQRQAPRTSVDRMVDLGDTIVSGARYEVLVLMVLGWVVARRRRLAGSGDYGELVALSLMLYFVAILGLVFSAGYVSRRHILPPVIIGFGFVGYAIPIFGRGLLEVGRRILAPNSPWAPTAGVALALGLSIVVALAVPKAIRPSRTNSLAERRAAEWLRGSSLSPGAVAAVKHRVAYYAGASFVPLRAIPEKEVTEYLRARGARYVVVDEEEIPEYPGLRGAADREMRLLHRENAADHSASVYEVPALPIGEAG